eukprot:466198-Prorocentrum_minimum.AAC.37
MWDASCKRTRGLLLAESTRVQTTGPKVESFDGAIVRVDRASDLNRLRSFLGFMDSASKTESDSDKGFVWVW